VKRSQLFAVIAAVVVAGLVFFLWPRRESDPRELIKQRTIQMARAAEEKNASFIMEQVSQDFRAGELGGRDQVKGLVVGQVMMGQWVRVFVVGIDVQMDGATEADMVGKFVLGRSQAAKVEDLGKDSSLSARRIEARWKKEADGEWRIISAKQRELTPGEMLP
jgi:ketosteroid isomerase-like protein